nr:hypothetical protein [uncultured Campylobacter sp.]
MAEHEFFNAHRFDLFDAHKAWRLRNIQDLTVFTDAKPNECNIDTQRSVELRQLLRHVRELARKV